MALHIAHDLAGQRPGGRSRYRQDQAAHAFENLMTCGCQRAAPANQSLWCAWRAVDRRGRGLWAGAGDEDEPVGRGVGPRAHARCRHPPDCPSIWPGLLDASRRDRNQPILSTHLCVMKYAYRAAARIARRWRNLPVVSIGGAWGALSPTPPCRERFKPARFNVLTIATPAGWRGRRIGVGTALGPGICRA